MLKQSRLAADAKEGDQREIGASQLILAIIPAAASPFALFVVRARGVRFDVADMPFCDQSLAQLVRRIVPQVPKESKVLDGPEQLPFAGDAAYARTIEAIEELYQRLGSNLSIQDGASDAAPVLCLSAGSFALLSKRSTYFADSHTLS